VGGHRHQYVTTEYTSLIKPDPAGACTCVYTFLKHFNYRGGVYSVQHLVFILMDVGYGHKVAIPQGNEVSSL
jgi:hypothetical protein